MLIVKSKSEPIYLPALNETKIPNMLKPFLLSFSVCLCHFIYIFHPQHKSKFQNLFLPLLVFAMSALHTENVYLGVFKLKPFNNNTPERTFSNHFRFMLCNSTTPHINPLRVDITYILVKWGRSQIIIRFSVVACIISLIKTAFSSVYMLL